jgi:hypothetical protein
LVALFDHDTDSKDHLKSFAILAGKNPTRMILRILISINILSSFYLIMMAMNVEYQLFIILSNGILFSILHFERFFEINERYRSVADGVFFIPIIFLLV